MTQKPLNLQKISVYMSYVLRHQPEALGIELDSAGWTDFEIFVSQMKTQYPNITKEIIHEIIHTDQKKRYSLQEGKIRANQGHSTSVNPVETQAIEPPAYLYHGTSFKNWESIQQSGAIKKMKRHHVHLSPDLKTAIQVAKRRKLKSIILKIKAVEMHQKGYRFYRSENNVWLIEEVPLSYIEPQVEQP